MPPRKIFQRDSALLTVFFVLPFTLLAARSMQSGGIYLFGILLPFWMIRRQWLPVTTWLPAGAIGTALVATYLVFPATDLLHWLWRPETPDLGILHGQVSSAVLISGLFLMGFAAVKPSLNRAQNFEGSATPDVFEAFTRGMLWATIALGAYLVLQYVTGYDVFSEYAFRQDRHFANGAYRVTGFTSHPITMAGMSLGIFAFYWALFWRRPRRDAFIISLCHFAFLIMTGCRAPTLVAAGLAVILPLLPGSKVPVLARAAIAGAVGLAAGGLAFATGLADRFVELSHQLTNTGMLDARQVFWTVHWTMFEDSPWIGQGYYWLGKSTREKYYESLGYSDFPRKYNAHNVFLETLTNLGVLGTTILLILLLGTYLTVRRAVTAHPSPTIHLMFDCLSVAIAANLVNGLTENTFYNAPVVYLYVGISWMLLWAGATQGRLQHPAAAS